MTVRRTLVRLEWLLCSQFGIDLRRFFRLLHRLPRFVRDWISFRSRYNGTLTWMPCVHDHYEECGSTSSEYFWQDLLVAQWIFRANPRRHVDVGSRVDGFVAHVASFREVEVFDVRPIGAQIPGAVFRQADLMASDFRDVLRKYTNGYCDSLSCLHAIEHFGLGRYGDPIDPRGHERGIANMAALLEPGGTLYLATPIGRERVEFNANRVFDPRTIIALAQSNGLTLRTLTVIRAGGSVCEVSILPEVLKDLAGNTYNLGIFVFNKANEPVQHQT